MIASGYPPAQAAGLERGCQRLSEALAARGHHVTVLTGHVRGAIRDAMESGVRVLRVLEPWGPGPLWGLSYRRQVRRWMIRLLPEWDLVMCHQLYLHSVEANAVARAHGRRACHLLVAAQEYSDVSRLAAVRGGASLVRRAVDADALFVLSAFSRQEVLAAGARPERVHYYRYFVDVERFRPGAVPPTRELLCLGRWHRQKNLPLLLEAFTRLASRVPDVRLRIVGAGEEEAALRRRVAGLDCRDRIAVEGWASDPVPVYQRAWALVTSSDAEGLSNVLIEAMASGAPVITTDVSGAREALDLGGAPPVPAGTFARGTGGWLVPMRDALALAAAMEHALGQASLREAMAAEARARAVAVFSEPASVSGFLAALGAMVPR
jgi:glycosyltransferase involved in cell wall biosynthesis